MSKCLDNTIAVISFFISIWQKRSFSNSPSSSLRSVSYTHLGAGNVGATCANVLAFNEVADEVVMLDVKEGVSEGKAMDCLLYTSAFPIPGMRGASGCSICASSGLEAASCWKVSCMEPWAVVPI